MVGWSRVAAYADVPIACSCNAGAGASGNDHTASVGRRGGRCRLVQGRNQRDYVLLVQGASTEGAHTDVEIPVLPEYIVIQNWDRILPAISSSPMALGTGDRRREIRLQNRAVLDAHQSGGLRSRGRAAVCRAGGTLRAGEGSPKSVEEHSRRGGGIVGNNCIVDDVHREPVEQRDSGSIPAGDVVGDDVVGDLYRVPICRSIREGDHL